MLIGDVTPRTLNSSVDIGSMLKDPAESHWFSVEASQ